ncbi:disulfide bond formation protein B [Candidatus Paracaedibacter symbiosus]|uniref:disulfide bond formation protein B n=1 Tax=Candidatus Paracaedibacter symbiosus TaxID=244582 RepID=UPI0018DD6A45|nr:disulfide bond formation protein B [Candidatus Paracaedibacter symbiosus]
MSRQFFLKTIESIATLALLTAFIAEYAFGIQPCPLCLYERYVYAALIILGIIDSFWYHPALFYLVLVVILGGIGLSFYHVGVELHWWQAPSSCVGISGISAGNFEDFEAQFMQKPVVRCDQITWVIFDVSATIWNMLLFCAMGLYALIVKFKSC